MDKELWRDWVENSYDTKQVIYKQKDCAHEIELLDLYFNEKILAFNFNDDEVELKIERKITLDEDNHICIRINKENLVLKREDILRVIYR